MGFYIANYGRDAASYEAAAKALRAAAKEVSTLAGKPKAAVESPWFSGAFAKRVIADVGVMHRETKAVANLLEEDAARLATIASEIRSELLFESPLTQKPPTGGAHG